MILFPVALFIMVALIFFYVNYNTKDKFQPINVGYAQMSILETYQQAEKALLYIDLSAKYSAYKTIHDLARNGGSFNDLECGKNNGFTLWNSQDKECFQENKAIYSEFTTYFNLNLNKYLEKYKESDENEELKIPIDNYNFLFKDKQMIGIATQNLVINKPNINYSIKPSFKVNLDYDLFQDYEYLVEKAKEIIEKCSKNKEPEESISDCVDSLIKEFNPKVETEEQKDFNVDKETKNFKWSYEKDGDIFMFSVEKNKKFPMYNTKTKKISEEPIIYKFALYLSQISETNP